MLTQQTVEYVYDLAAQLNEAGVGVRAIPYTPVANVVTAGFPSFGSSDAFIQEIQNNAKSNVVSAITGATRNTDIMSPHSAAVFALSTQLAENVTRHVSVARSVVSPAVQTFATEALIAIEAYRHIDPVEGFRIDKVYIPEPLLTESLLADLAPYSKSPIPDLMDSIQAGPASDEELITNLFTGSASVDTAIKEWIGSIDIAVLRKVWDTHFLTGTTPAFDKQIHVGSAASQLNEATALYLYVRRLVNNPVAVQGLTPLSYNTKLAVIELYAGSIISNSLREADYSAKIDRLVMGTSSAAKSITVYGPTYDRYMADGGSVEVLLGMLTEGISAVSLAAVKEVSDKAIAGWNRYISLSNYQNRKNRTEILRTIYGNVFVNQFSDLGEFEKGYNEKHPGHADICIKKSRDYLNSLSDEELENVNAVAMKLVAGIRFGFTQAEQILGDIEAAMTANPNLDPREAATIAVINLVTDYVSAQLQRY